MCWQVLLLHKSVCDVGCEFVKTTPQCANKISAASFFFVLLKIVSVSVCALGGD